MIQYWRKRSSPTTIPSTITLSRSSALIGKIAANPDDGEYALDLLMIAKYFERIGDHAVNIAEWVIFSITGVHNAL